MKRMTLLWCCAGAAALAMFGRAPAFSEEAPAAPGRPAEATEAVEKPRFTGLNEKRMACYDASQPGWKSGSDPLMTDASMAYVGCLDGIIREIAAIHYPQGLKGLETLRKAKSDLYFEIYDGCEGCGGTAARVFAATALQDEYENLLAAIAGAALPEE